MVYRTKTMGDTSVFNIFHNVTIPSARVFLALICLSFPVVIRIYVHTVGIIGKLRSWKSLMFHTLILRIEKRKKYRLTRHDKSDEDQIIHLSKIGCLIPVYLNYVVEESTERLRVTWPGCVSLEILHNARGQSHIYSIKWTALGNMSVLEDVVLIDRARWYGHGISYRQHYPVEKWRTQLIPFVPRTPGDTHLFSKEYFGLVQERLWVNSSGVAMRADSEVPLFVSVNEKQTGILRLVARFNQPFHRQSTDKLALNYTLIQSRNPKEVQRLVTENVMNCQKITALDPVVLWHTPPSYKTFSDISAYAKQIIDAGLHASYIQIPSCNASDSAIEQNRELNERLRKLGYKIATELCLKDKMAYGSLGNEIERLAEKLPFDLLNVSMMDLCDSPLHSNNPSLRINKLCLDVRQLIPSRVICLMDAGVSNQDVDSTVFQLRRKQHSWSQDGGLQSVIPEMLNQSILGYPFLLSGSVGGDDNIQTDSELYIRWLQTVVLFPFMKMRIPPWHFPHLEVTRITKLMFELRETFSSRLSQLTKEAAACRTPIIRPLWWLAPEEDEAAQTICSEFALGNEVIVAPVLWPGARYRDIYLPRGTWRDGLRNNLVAGQTWIRNYPADLDELPHFFKVLDG